MCLVTPHHGLQHRLWQLVIEKSLAAFPQRHTDGAYIVRCHDHDSGKGVAFKLNANFAPPVLVERYVRAPFPFRDGVMR